MDLVVLETPGHTPGSVCFYSEKEGILFSGDTLFFDGVGRSDLPGGSEKKLRESIQKKIAVLPPETRVFPGHGPFTTVEREKRGNVYLKGMAQEVRTVAVQRTPLVTQSPAAGPGRLPAAAQRPLGAAKRPLVKPSSAAGNKPRLKRPSAPGKKPLARPSTAKRPHAGAKRLKAGAQTHSKQEARPPRSAPAARRTGKTAARKRPVVVKKGPAARQPRRKTTQATRSTKAPGAGRKPAR
jgi:hypothetical protein